MANSDFKYRSLNGRIFQTLPDGDRVALTTGQARKRLNEQEDRIKELEAALAAIYADTRAKNTIALIERVLKLGVHKEQPFPDA